MRLYAFGSFGHTTTEVTELNEEIRLLNAICKNTEMGIDGIKTVQKRCKNRAMQKALQRQLDEYSAVFESADHLLNRIGESPKQIHAAAKISAHLAANLKCMRSASPSVIAGMMIQGSTMGIIQMTRQIRRDHTSSAAARQLADRLIATEESNIESMKAFL